MTSIRLAGALLSRPRVASRRSSGSVEVAVTRAIGWRWRSQEQSGGGGGHESDQIELADAPTCSTPAADGRYARTRGRLVFVSPVRLGILPANISWTHQEGWRDMAL